MNWMTQVDWKSLLNVDVMTVNREMKSSEWEVCLRGNRVKALAARHRDMSILTLPLNPYVYHKEGTKWKDVSTVMRFHLEVVWFPFSDATFLAILTAPTYISNITNTIIVFSGTPINPGSHYIPTGTDSGKYCVPYTGVYEFNVQFRGNNWPSSVC